MKITLTLIFIFCSFYCKAQAPALIHYEQNETMHLTPTGNNYKVYAWVDSNQVKHSKKFYVGQRYIDPYDGIKNVWVIYEICDQGVWSSCKRNEGDSYRAYETFTGNDIKFLTTRKK